MDEIILTEEQWKNWWAKNNENDCHESDNPFSSMNPLLEKHFGNFISKPCRVLVPLCGSSPDIKWLAEKGNKVVGVEWSKDAVLQFIKKNNYEFDLKLTSLFDIYEVKNVNIKFFVGNFLNFTPELAGGKFDFVWDTASLQTIPLGDRTAYSNVILKSMQPSCTYMVSAMYFGELRTWTENPYELSTVDLMDLYGKLCSIEKIDEDHSEYGVENIMIIKFKK